ncbi:hypothetical protein WUBG_00121 [Wuchereria bancrofti]|uniref:ShKT domain-containing protein n=1 Tax=Wuchereria bancrofti TaxID=6293 RepID=J9F242_WUCBA|nr:hypothetical protein WUBG_00121 [Wuchereria bancrofti]
MIYGIYHFNEEQRRQIIAIHNQLRAREPASNMQELVWDQRLADLAYGHAKRCDAWHRSAYERQGHGYSYIGENIWWSNEAYLRSNLQSAMLDFFNERPYYDYNTNKCMKGAQCGHYTQYVWGETCAVGCAAVHCNGIKNGRGINQGHIIICNYGEGGNQFEKRPYIFGPRCSNCRCGGECTSEGLCPPCCSGMRYPQQGNFLPSPVLRTQQSRKSWQNKIGVQQKHKNYQQNGNGKLYNYECRDFEPFCEHWAQNVGCYSKHRNFMMKRCPKTCNTCYPFFSAVNQVFSENLEEKMKKFRLIKTEKFVGDVHPVSYVISVRSCIDNNRNCNLWAQYGECYGPRKAYMAANCRFSCALCTPSSYYERKYQRRRRNWNSLLPSDSILLPSTLNNFGELFIHSLVHKDHAGMREI